jgi:predicted transcriptional regulator
MRNELPAIKRRLSRLPIPVMEQVAEKADIGMTSVWRVARGVTPNPGYLTVYRIVKAMRSLGV